MCDTPFCYLADRQLSLRDRRLSAVSTDLPLVERARPPGSPDGSRSGDGAGAVPSARRIYSPVTPSMDSRIRSAWPLWRAYSSIMCR